ncbi:MAG: AI-2E family transporter [Wolbachia endosymbiont of Menacanthus eurysternus]|nr:MAG: AI-2E family transporter [Wolbachia endosymbiont of Menacanthus eurysternus]
MLLFTTGTLFLMRPMIFPCLISIIVAYLCNPLVVKFEKYKIPRLYSAIFITIILLIILILIFAFILPIIYVQISSILNFLISRVPSLNLVNITSKLKFLDITKDCLFDYLYEIKTKNYENNISYFISIFDIIGNFLIQVLNSSFNLIHTLSLIAITPAVFFYILRDWPFIVIRVNKLIPIPYREEVVKFFLKIDFIVSNYLKGQINICIFMMIFYSIGLDLIGLKHSITIGILSGALTFIPCIGPLLYTIIGVLSVIAQFNRWSESVAVLTLFGIEQIIDTNLLVPLLIGKKIHMHPTIIILGITICTSYFGIIGILLFIPTIAVFYASTRCIIYKYLKSKFYKNG